ncbi:hypothetical protein MMC18_001217 [Xylographa bjoerkii]|nr:hypothetical protein [Xylographa bjoerkii]
MDAPIHPFLLQSDLAVLQNLREDIKTETGSGSIEPNDHDNQSTLDKLGALKDEPTIFCSYDLKDLPLSKDEGLPGFLLQRYISWAQTVVRNPVDVVFLTHILLYFSTSVPSALYLYYHFSYVHGVCHWVMQLYYCGSFTLMLHNHIHNNGILAKRYALFDYAWPYVLEPLMGHTWDSYFYHHVKHHHVEGNGPEDLSSTIRYQRDELLDFLCYVGRFLAFIWIELPIYFLRKNKFGLATKAAVSELTSYGFIYFLAHLNFYPTLFVFILPLIQMRIGLMVGNFGQHALVDDIDPKSDFRSSITLIDVPSNRYCFNDGWHTSHHLNPRRHWRDHPTAFLKAKREYSEGRALVFQNIDYLMMTYRILKKDYLYLADCIVPMGEQIHMSKQELADMLRTKTRRFSEDEIQKKFYKAKRNMSRENLPDGLLAM